MGLRQSRGRRDTFFFDEAHLDEARHALNWAAGSATTRPLVATTAAAELFLSADADQIDARLV
jgi:hypothetical protein